MAYSRDLLKMAIQHVALWIGMYWYGFVGRVWHGGGQMTSEFIHEEISIMDYNGLS